MDNTLLTKVLEPAC